MLAACAGSGGGNTATDGTSPGVVTGFRSIYVNGVEHETGRATVDIDGVSSIETDLGVGEVAEIEGSVNLMVQRLLRTGWHWHKNCR